MATTVIYLWSEGSPLSRQYLTAAASGGARTLCVDNPVIRRQILSSSKVRVTAVPCLLVAANGQLAQYEGEQAIQWIHQTYLGAHQPQPQYSPPPQQYQPQRPQYYPQQQYPPQQYPPQQYQPQQPQESPAEEIKFKMTATAESVAEAQRAARAEDGPGQGPAPGQGPQGLPQQTQQLMSQGPITSPQMMDGPAEQPIKFAMSATPPGHPGNQGPQMGQQQQGGQMGQQQYMTQFTTPQYSTQLPPDVTPASQLVPEPPVNAPSAPQNLGHYTSQAMQHYQQFQQPPPDHHNIQQVKHLSPKESNFQRILAAAQSAAHEQEKFTNIQMASSS